VVAACVAALGWGGVRLGLDLKGGSHIVMQIQVQDAFKSEADQLIEQIKEQVAHESIERNDPESIDTAETIQISVRGVQPDQVAALRRIAGDEWILNGGKLTLRKEAAIKLRNDTIARTISTLEKKVNGLGVAEATVQQRGGSEGEAEVVVQLPGVDDLARAKSVLQAMALLELAEVRGGPYPTREAAGALPMNSHLVPDARGDSFWVLARNAVVNGRDLRNARAQQSSTNQSWETSFTLTQEAAKKFERFTGSHIGSRLAIVLDKKVLSAPSIEGTIRDNGVINNMGSMEEATDLALNLRSGSLPAGLKLIEERTVGPSLGADSIRRGLAAGLTGLALVIASMILYYRGAGWNAVLALLLNTLMTVAALSYVDATWTLPGIAGLVLSIGMAVDSNVLIFERIKEEMREGKAVAAAIKAGFDRALVTIIDTHVTTVVASTFLFLFGTGPVRGFAVTLVVGLVANLFTAVFVSRAIFDVKLWRSPRLATLSIGKELFQATNIDFLSQRGLTFGLSVVAIAISIASLAVKGGPQYGLDFRGGTQMYVRFDPKPPIDDVRKALSAKLEVSLQETPGTGEFIIGTGLADEKSLDQARQTVENTLREKYANLGGKLDLNNATQAALEDRLRGAVPADVPAKILNYRDHEKAGIIRSLDELTKLPGVDAKALDAIRERCGLSNFNIRSVEIVGPRAGAQLRQQALLATAGALGGMLIYIAFRFQLISGAAAVIATLHDVIITLGLFSLTNREIDLTIIAALLTLIGYSMNDKIVVFDRVRENMQKAKRGAPFLELVNQSINQTLSRTILTAGPTLLACLALYFLGGEVLNGIAFALFVGIVAGTYSSIFVASALLVMWRTRSAEYRPGSAPAESSGLV
jgi:protein-export membrane protein SecD/preprotein translocase SecF subunit